MSFCFLCLDAFLLIDDIVDKEVIFHIWWCGYNIFVIACGDNLNFFSALFIFSFNHSNGHTSFLFSFTYSLEPIQWAIFEDTLLFFDNNKRITFCSSYLNTSKLHLLWQHFPILLRKNTSVKEICNVLCVWRYVVDKDEQYSVFWNF